MQSVRSSLTQHFTSRPLLMIFSTTIRQTGRPATPCPTDLDLPAIPGWHLVRRLGGGALTSVFQARPQEAAVHQPAGYALKTVAPGLADDALARQFLYQEARAARSVQSPHIVPVLSARLKQSPPLLVMPLLAGMSLGDLLVQTPRPVLPVALWIARQIAEGLDSLHQAGWVHGDIKPDNAMVAPSGHVTLVDLGFAHPAEEHSAVPCDERLMGTPSYLAPEAFASRLRPDIRSDLYSLGVLLYEMLAGRRPFAADDAAELARQHCEHRPAELRILLPHLPTRASRLVAALLAKDPDRRPQTPREVINRLMALEIEAFADHASPAVLRGAAVPL